MDKHELSFDERRFLAAYERFYGEPYPADGDPNSHEKAQAMVYLLGLKSIRIGDFGFSWHGGVPHE